MKKDAKTLLKDNTMLIVLVLVFIFFIITTKGVMFQPMQFNALVTQNAYVFILSCGMLMCMLTGGNIDLSCGAFVCLVGAIGGYLMIVKGVNVGVSIALMLLVGVVYGCVLGYLVAYVEIPPWIATLAGFLAFRGLGTEILITNSDTGTLAPFPESFLNVFSGKIFSTKPNAELNMPCFIVGIVACLLLVVLNFRSRAVRVKKGYEADSFVWTLLKTVLLSAVIMLFAWKLAMSGGIPVVLIWVAVIVLIYSFITGKTTIGRHFYVVGGNREAARLSGIDTRKVMFIAYLNMAVITVITSFVALSRFQSSTSTLGTNYEMDAISACVVGGVSAYGGAGTVPGMLIGALLIGVMNLGMSLMNQNYQFLDANVQKVVKGIVLLGAVAFDIISKKKSK